MKNIVDDASSEHYIGDDVLDNGPQFMKISLKKYLVQDSTPYKPQDFDYGPNSYLNRYSTLRNYFFVGYDDKRILLW